MNSTVRAKTPKLDSDSDFAEKQDAAAGIGSTDAKNTVNAGPYKVDPPQGAIAGQPESILDLPDEVKKNIVGYEDMELDEMLLRLLGGSQGAITCDRLIQLLWVKFKRNPSRTKVMARLRFLSAANSIEKMEGCRSMYRAVLPLMAASAGVQSAQR